jgi:hypothetical protein
MPRRAVEIGDEQRREFASLYLLDYMVKHRTRVPLYLDAADADLEPLLEHLLVRKCVAIEDQSHYVVTDRGRRALSQFMARYSEFLQMFDIFCAVDLAAGEFAFARYLELDGDAWKRHVAEPRFDDLRVAVAKYKQLDPVEIVFMSFLNEGRFGRDHTGWQFDLLLGTVWDEIRDIVAASLHVEDLGYEDAQGRVDGNDVITDVIHQGTALLMELLEEEARRTGWRTPAVEHPPGGGGKDDDVSVVHHPASYYHPYLDPEYVSPRWLGRLLR